MQLYSWIRFIPSLESPKDDNTSGELLEAHTSSSSGSGVGGAGQTVDIPRSWPFMLFMTMS